MRKQKSLFNFVTTQIKYIFLLYFSWFDYARLENFVRLKQVEVLNNGLSGLVQIQRAGITI